MVAIHQHSCRSNSMMKMEDVSCNNDSEVDDDIHNPPTKPVKKKKIVGASFAALGLSPFAAAAAGISLGFRQPTPIQRQAIPPIVDGRDVIALARTGSGKTAAYLLPLMDKIKEHQSIVGVRALVLIPTRELANQVASVLKKIIRKTDIIFGVLLGGKGYDKQFDILSRNPDILVCTPGRLMQLYTEKVLSLSRVSMVVFDEVDQLLSLGWKEEMFLLSSALPTNRQSVLTSATLPSNVVDFVRLGLNDPVFIQTDQQAQLSDTLKLNFLFLRDEEKLPMLVHLLQMAQIQKEHAFVFTSTRHQGNFLQYILEKFGLKTSVMYGSMEQQERERKMHEFRKGHLMALLVTDVAARGLDVPLLDLVIHYDFPTSPKLFMHRVGRTARGGKSGRAVSLLTFSELPYAFDVMTFLGGKIVSVDVWKKLQTGDSFEQQNGLSESFGAENEDSSLEKRRVYPIAGPPEIGMFAENVNSYLRAGTGEVDSLQRAAKSAQKLYFKTRPSASRSSSQRAKEFLDECGGSILLSRTVHPEYEHSFLLCKSSKTANSSLPKVIQAAAKAASAAVTRPSQEVLDCLKNFRPKVGVKGSVLSPSVVVPIHYKKNEKNMLLKACSNLVLCDERQISVRGNQERVHGIVCTSDARSIASEHAKNNEEENDSSVQTPVIPQEAPLQDSRRPRMSKRRRMKYAKASGNWETGVGADAFLGKENKFAGGYGSAVDSRELCLNKQFFLDTSGTAKTCDGNVNMQLKQASVDLISDEREDLQRQRAKEKRQWDPKKCKMVLMKTDSATGKAVKRMRADPKQEAKTSSATRYAQWSKATKKRIQKPGEEQDQSSLTSFEPVDATMKQPSENPIPHTSIEQDLVFKGKHLGLKEALLTGQPLTHKQTRLVKKLLGNSKSGERKTKNGEKRGGLLSSKEIIKRRSQQEKRSFLKDKRKRVEASRQSKAAYMKKQEKRMALRGAPNRSMAIVKKSRYGIDKNANKRRHR